MSKTIGEALFLEADMVAHQAYLHDAMFLRDQYLAYRPRIDTREDLVYLDGQIDALYEYHCEQSGMTLRKIVVDWGSSDLVMGYPPFAGPFPWEKGS